MKKSKYLLATALMMATSFTSAATLKAGTGGPNGSYFGMGQDVVSYCADELSQDSIEILPSSGSVENLVGLGTKQFALGIVQEDVLQFFAKRTPKKVNKNSIKVITPMHVEAMHLLIPKGYSPKGQDSGFFSKFWSGDDKPQAIDINLLKNQQISAWGGSAVSAKALSYFFDLNAQLVEINSGDMPNTPIIIVAGYPSKVVEKYLDSGNYNIVAIDYNKVNQRADFYTDEILNYSINGTMQSVPTVGVRALFVGKSFRKASRNTTSSELSTCIYEYLGDLADDPSTSPNWGSVYDFVDDEQQVDWDYFPLLETSDY